MKSDFMFKKRIILFCISVFVILFTYSISFPQCVQPPSGMAGWWAGDGNALDNRGPNHATLLNGATYAAGRVNQSFNFNGSSQYLSTPQAANLPVRGTNSFTIDAWINHQGGEANELFNVFAYRNGGQDIQFFVTRTQIGIWGTSSAGMIILTPHNVNAAAWNHYAFSREGNTWRVYVNGNQVGSDAANSVSLLTPTTPQNIGTTGLANTQFALGMIDEIEIFNRALSLAEIQSIYNAGSAGKCRTCITAPNGQISLWKAENNPLDANLLNNGTLVNNAAFAAGKVGQTFSFNGTQYVEIPDSPGLRPTNGLTLEGWFKFNTSNPNGALISKPLHGANSDSFVIWTQGGGLAAGIVTGIVGIPFTPTPGDWYHIAYTYDEMTFQHRLFVNGEVVASSLSNSDFVYDDSPVIIGGDKDSDIPVLLLNGMADEASIYNRGLAIEEVRSIVFAGNAGKCLPCAPAAVGLVSWWRAETNALDSRSGFNGTMQNGAGFAPGAVGQAFSFDGVDDFVSVPNNPALDPTNTGSIGAWVKFDQLPSDAGRIMEIVGKGSSGNDFDLQADPDNRFRLYVAAGTNVPSTTIIQTGVWYHVVGTWNSTVGLKIYVNGVLENTNPTLLARSPSGQPLHIGHHAVFPGRFFDGNIDEVSVYNRALSAMEIQSVAVAGQSGMCSPTATTAPPNLVGWWAGDGNVFDVSGQSVGGTLLDAAGYAVGKAGQGFNFNGTLNSGVTIPHHSYFNILAPGFTTEFWMKSNGAQPGNLATLVEKSHGFVDSTGWAFTAFSSTNTVHFAIGDGGAGNNSFVEVISNAGILDGNYHHIAGIWDGSDMRLYVDGVLHGTTPMAAPANNGRGVNFGFAWGAGLWQRFFNGKIDEVSIYNRALTIAEIQSIYNAGIAGKLKSAITPAGFAALDGKAQKTLTGEAVNTPIGDATVTFPGVTTAGETQEIPFSLNGLPPLPMGYYSTGLSYDVSTSAIYSGTPSVCFNLPALSPQFASLRILHLENGHWIDRTLFGGTSPTLCTSSLTSLSPFAIASVVPTAAMVKIRGQVRDAFGNGIRRARVTLTDMEGNTRSALTSSFGYYTFEGVEAGETYILQVSRRSYQFADPTQVVIAHSDLTGVDFVAEN